MRTTAPEPEFVHSRLLKMTPDTTQFQIRDLKSEDRENDRNHTNITQRPRFNLKLSQVEQVGTDLIETPRVTVEKVKHMIITQNDEAVLRHEFA